MIIRFKDRKLILRKSNINNKSKTNLKIKNRFFIKNKLNKQIKIRVSTMKKIKKITKKI
jgi:hypothetical protein